MENRNTGHSSAKESKQKNPPQPYFPSYLNINSQDFPGDLVVKIWISSVRGMDSVPGRELKSHMPHK